ncbi:C-5 sterol desaturase [Aeromicrobium sp. SMF47]|uniref:sterol desaturase family protein n=1 Tax=Aeromicrobium TaxID=2040 RepID=UPI00129EF038|nr:MULTISPECIES: sterol desaturase family protein [Aeromicrobium]MRJ76879.1 C-5 sterol desaturase [Aeromicrobium yanjiei]MRK01223.1 C-5 sterol desaturase [Aeromicrobium sp. S22]
MWDAFSHNLKDPAGAAIPFFLLFMVIEMFAVRREEAHDRDEQSAHQVKGYLAEDTRTSLTMFGASIAFSAVFRTAAFLLYTVLYVHVAPWHLSASNPWTWVGVIIGVDFLWYVYHRFAHRVRIGWAGHQAHHSSLFFNFSTALRQKWNQWFEVLIWLPLPLLGVPPWMIYFVFSLNLIWQFHLHTEKIEKFPRWWEAVFNTPSHHRVHHGSDAIYLDRNYGGIFIVWDRLFGSFQPELHRPTYGLTVPVDTYNVWSLQYGEYKKIWQDVRQARGVRDKLGYVLGPPGWAPRSHAGGVDRGRIGAGGGTLAE